ncbi:hypothetical protein NDU88_000726 [Pleurodeles waltl]|uniref:Uncharacterized protein n=1 Tax=Pleurodeles waltl TaxID=8319 RepID=A0AAV7P6L1_PLEWA|nr:hypothetical protein NDU88_000726 [Pleurodeles waltl]
MVNYAVTDGSIGVAVNGAFVDNENVINGINTNSEMEGVSGRTVVTVVVINNISVIGEVAINWGLRAGLCLVVEGSEEDV